MLYMIGLGLGDERDITLRGLEAVKSCSKARKRPRQRARRAAPRRCAALGRRAETRVARQVYLEAYTSILGVDASKLVRAAQPRESRRARLRLCCAATAHRAARIRLARSRDAACSRSKRVIVQETRRLRLKHRAAAALRCERRAGGAVRQAG
jgi:hypothetical protein